MLSSCRAAGAPAPRGGRSASSATTTFAAPSAARLIPRCVSASAGPGASPHARASPVPQQQHHIGGEQRRAAPFCTSYNSSSASASAASSSPTKPSSSDSANASSPTSTSSSKPFSWTSQWYPVAVESDLPRDRPVPIKLLGRRLVLWWAGGEEEGWSCLDDACSHRLAPLSEGRIDKSCVSCKDSKPCRALACSYHGFSFDGNGKVISLPQARHDGGVEAERRAAASSRARVRSHPTLARDQLVWVWAGGGGGDEAAKEAAEAPLPPGPPEEIRRLMLEAAGAEAEAAPQGNLVALITNQQYFRDLPVPFDVMMENLADQSHVPFAHTGVASSRESPFANHFTVSNVNAHLKREEEEEEGTKKANLLRSRFPGAAAADLVSFDLEWAPDALALAKQEVTIVPPCYIEYSTPLQSKRDLEVAGKSTAVKEIGLRACLWFYATPLDENTTRVFNNAVVVSHGLPLWASRLLNKRPKWVDHLFLQNVLDGDVAYLPQAAANAKLGLFSSSDSSLDVRGERWPRRYFMPANADASVVAWRRWLHGERGGSGWLDAVADNERGAAAAVGGRARVGGESFPALSSSKSGNSNAIPLPRSDLPRSELFDRWNQHTKNCPSCSKAMSRAQGAKKAFEVSAVVSGMVASSAALLLLLLSSSAASASGEANDASQLLLRVLLSSSALAALSLLVRRAAAELESWFVFKDYEHWKS